MRKPENTGHGKIAVKLKHRDPGYLLPTTYTQTLTEAAIGAVMMVMDCLAEQTTDEDVRRVGDALADVVAAVWGIPRAKSDAAGDRLAAWHTIRRHEGEDPFTGEECELIDATHPDQCADLPPWAVCWFDHEPHHTWWPAGLGTWRIRPVEMDNGGTEDGPNEPILTLEIQAFDENTGQWANWDGPTVGERTTLAEQLRAIGAEQAARDEEDNVAAVERAEREREAGEEG